MTDGLLSKSPVAESTNTFRIGTTPSVSAHGTSDGIVWAVERQDGLGGKPMQNPAILRAYDATNVANSLYSSAEVASRDQMGCATKFSVPTVANGRVYVGTQNELDVFGILNSSSGPNVHLSWPCHDFFGQAVNVRSHAVHISLTNSGTATMNISSIALAGVNADQFALTSTCNSTLAPGESCMLDLFFSPTAIGIQTASVMILDDAPGSPHNIYLLGNGEAPWW